MPDPSRNTPEGQRAEAISIIGNTLKCRDPRGSDLPARTCRRSSVRPLPQDEPALESEPTGDPRARWNST